MIISMIFFLLSPLTPTILLYINKKREGQLQKNAATMKAIEDHAQTDQRIQLYKVREILIKDKKKIEAFLGMSYKIETVLESTPQVLIQFMVVLMSASILKLPQITGIEAVFNTTTDGNDGFTLSKTFFYVSIAISLNSIYSELFRTFLMEKENSVPDLGKLLKFLLYFLGSSSRIFAIVLYFAPFLGIMDLMLPYSIDSMMTYSDTVKEKIGAEILDEMSEITWYTGIDLNTSLILFLLFPVMHVLAVLIMKGHR